MTKWPDPFVLHLQNRDNLASHNGSEKIEWDDIMMDVEVVHTRGGVGVDDGLRDNDGKRLL